MIVSLPGSRVDGFIFCHMLRYLDGLFCGVFCVGFCDEGVTRGVGRGVLFVSGTGMGSVNTILVEIYKREYC